MIKITALFLSILSIHSFASDLKISYSSQNNLILSGNSCEELLSEQDALCTWKEKVEGLKVTQKGSCYKNKSGGISLTVSKCLPTFVKNYQNKKNYKSGANCWGTAMSFKSISLRPRFIWQKEMIYWMNSPLCRKLEVGEKKEVGDILNIYGPEYVFKEDEKTNKGFKFWNALYPNRLTSSPVSSGYSGYHQFLHSETYISDKISFGKDSPSKDDRFKFNPLKEVYGRSRTPECQENQAMSPYFREYQNPPKDIKGSKCDYFSLAYRCQNFDDYFSKQVLTLDEMRILDEINNLKKIQDKLFPLLVEYKKVISQNEIKQMLSLSDREAKNSLNELQRGALDKNHEMLLSLKYFTAEGIRKSLELADLTSPTEER